MIWYVIINLATTIIIIGGIINATQKQGKPRWFQSKKVIRVSVLVSAFVALCGNIYLSHHDEQYSHSLLKKVDSLQVRMKILDTRLIENSKESLQTPFSISITDSDSNSRARGNVAGYVKDTNGEGVPSVTITRLANNVNTVSHEGGEFIVVSVIEGEMLKFQKKGYKDFEYKVKHSDFNKLVEINIKED